MRNYYFIFFGLAFSVFMNACETKSENSKASETGNSQALYFGQKPPGTAVEIFAPGIVSLEGRYAHGIVFSPDLDEVLFSANKVY